MTDYKADAAKANRPGIDANRAGEVIVQPFKHTTTAEVGNNEHLALCKLPPRHVPVDLLLNVDELDSGADALVFDVGVVETDFTDVDQNALISGSTAGQAGGLVRMDQVAGINLAPSDNERYIALKVTTPAGTWQNGDVVGWFQSRPADSYHD